jgi:16S rRNA (adenine1518-N6/adenine1519-N6)-dimethyltransferase
MPESRKAKKRFGQNFLVDKNILNKIIAAAELDKSCTVLEIGMGEGALTEELAKAAGKVITVEIDRELFPETKEKLERYSNIDFILGDFLKKADDIFGKLTEKIKVVANIPYYITTPIIEKLFVYADKIDSIILMVQREVADRLRASPATKDYGSLTLFVNYHCDVEKICDVPPTAFVPRPKVFSSVIKLSMRNEKKYFVDSMEKLFNIIHAAFWGRRKMLSSALRKAPMTKLLAEDVARLRTVTGIDLTRRGETLTMEEFILLAQVKLSERE